MRADPLPPLHAVTDDATVARPDFLRSAEQVARAGGADVAIHLRAPSASGLALFRLAEAVRELTANTGALFFVNDRVDVALAVDADGVQLGRRSLLPADARALAGLRVGASVGSRAEGEDAHRGGADFLLMGNVFVTDSHPGRAGIGVGALGALPLPCVAIGGVRPEDAARLRSAGASGIAAIRGIWNAARPADAVRAYLGEWRG